MCRTAAERRGEHGGQGWPGLRGSGGAGAGLGRSKERGRERGWRTLPSAGRSWEWAGTAWREARGRQGAAPPRWILGKRRERPRHHGRDSGDHCRDRELCPDRTAETCVVTGRLLTSIVTGTMTCVPIGTSVICVLTGTVTFIVTGTSVICVPTETRIPTEHHCLYPDGDISDLCPNRDVTHLHPYRAIVHLYPDRDGHL